MNIHSTVENGKVRAPWYGANYIVGEFGGRSEIDVCDGNSYLAQGAQGE